MTPAGRFIYSQSPGKTTQMIETAYRGTLLALYQFSILLGILLLPVALAARQAGLRMPMDRVIERLDEAYENAA